MIKTIVGEPKPKEVKGFPKYMIVPDSYNKGMIVLFRRHGVGTVIHSGTSINVPGDHAANWCMSGFTDLNELITSQNV